MEGKRLRIAVIEDEALVAMLIEDQLTAAGHDVVGAADSYKEAVRLVAETSPDLALVDVQLADGSSGLEVADTLAALGVPCLFATGNCPAEAGAKAIGCLHKPFSAADLMGAISAVTMVLKGSIPTALPRELHLYAR